jgi:hypothetical protein
MPAACAPSTSVSTAALAQLAHDVRDRQDEAGLTRHVVDEREPGAGCDARQDALDDFARVRDRDRNLDHVDAQLGALGGVVERVLACVIRMIGHEQRISARERERAQHRVHARGRVAHEHEVLRPRADEARHLAPRGVE